MNIKIIAILALMALLLAASASTNTATTIINYFNYSNNTNSSIQINESQVNNLSTDLNTKVNKSGDTMIGDLSISKGIGRLFIYSTQNGVSSAIILHTNSSGTDYSGGLYYIPNGASSYYCISADNNICMIRVYHNNYVAIDNLAGSGNAHVCVDAAGNLYRSSLACV